MKQILFTSQAGSQTMVTVDASTDNAGRYTILSVEKKVKGADNDFEKLFPWNRGQVVEDTAFQNWLKRFGGFFSNITEYFIGGQNTTKNTLASYASDVTISVDATSIKDDAKMKVVVVNPDGMATEIMEMKVTKGDENIKQLSILKGWEVVLSEEEPFSFDNTESVLEDTTEITIDKQKIKVNIYDLNLIPEGE